MDKVNILTVAQSLLDTKHAYVASATLLFYDMAATFDEEVTRVWQARKTIGTTLFFINRYLPPALFIMDLAAQFKWNPSVKFCKNYEVATSLIDMAAIATVQSILIMRTHALYRNRRLLYFLCGFGLLSLVSMAVCFLVVFPHETFLPASVLGLPGCASGCLGPLCRPVLIVFWIPFLLFETVVFGLTAWQSYGTWANSVVNHRQTRSMQLVSLLFRDGLIYYIVIMGVSLFNFLIWILDPFASYLAVGLLKSLQATICSRLLLNIRGMLDPQNPSTTSGNMNNVITMSSFPSPAPKKTKDLSYMGPTKESSFFGVANPSGSSYTAPAKEESFLGPGNDSSFLELGRGQRSNDNLIGDAKKIGMQAEGSEWKEKLLARIGEGEGTVRRSKEAKREYIELEG